MEENQGKKDISFFQREEQMRYRDVLYLYSRETEILFKQKQQINASNDFPQHRKWNDNEVAAIDQSVKEFGKGNWSKV